jgi:hypothetical protein
MGDMGNMGNDAANPGGGVGRGTGAGEDLNADVGSGGRATPGWI